METWHIIAETGVGKAVRPVGFLENSNCQICKYLEPNALHNSRGEPGWWECDAHWTGLLCLSFPCLEEVWEGPGLSDTPCSIERTSGQDFKRQPGGRHSLGGLSFSANNGGDSPFPKAR